MRQEWLSLVDTEGVPVEQGEVSEDGEPPCPACGTAAALVDGACSDCGLHLG